MTWAVAVAACVVGYCLGMLNPATMVAKAKGVNLRAIGSGNPGATNAGRALGKGWGVVIGLLDIAKGLVPALLFAFYDVGAAELAGFMAVVGHITSPLLRGRGGKGVATTLGAVLGAQPLWAPVLLIAFAIGYLLTKRVGMGAVLAALALIVLAFLADSLSTTLFGFGMGLLILVRHWRNLGAAFSDWFGAKQPSED